MVASRQVERPFYRVIGRQRGRGLGVLAQVIQKTAIPFLRKYVVLAAERVDADLFELAVPEIADVLSGRKSFQTPAESTGRQTLKKQLTSGSKKRKPPIAGSQQRKVAVELSRQAESFQQNMQFKPVGRNETIRSTFFIDHVEEFLVPTFCGSFWNLGGEVPVVNDILTSNKKNYPSILLDENCIDFEFETNRNFCVDLRQT